MGLRWLSVCTFFSVGDSGDVKVSSESGRLSSHHQSKAQPLGAIPAGNPSPCPAHKLICSSRGGLPAAILAGLQQRQAPAPSHLSFSILVCFPLSLSLSLLLGEALHCACLTDAMFSDGDSALTPIHHPSPIVNYHRSLTRY